MKLLVISESPLHKIGAKYYAVDPWIRIPRYISEHCDRVTLWSPVMSYSDNADPPRGSWHIDPGKMRIVPHDYYCRFVDYYRLLFRRFVAWRKKADCLICEHDAVIIRAPSPMAPLIVSSARRQKRPVVLMLLLNIITQSDRLLTSRGIKKIIYKIIFNVFVRKEKKAARHSDMIYVYSKELAERHHSNNGKLRLIQDPHLNQGDIFLRNDTCDSGDEIRLLRACWLIPSKGVEYLLRAVALLLLRGLKVRLEIVGQERTAGYQKSLEDIAKNLGIQERVIFSGWVPFDRMSEVYLRNDIQILSSLGEGTPRCIVEGFARGLPLICSDVGGCKDTLVHERDTLMVPPADPEAIADAVVRLVHDGNLRRNLIKRGYELAQSVTFEKLGMQFIDEIRTVCRNEKYA